MTAPKRAVDPVTRDEIAAELAKHDWRDWKCSCGVAMEDLTNDVPHATYLVREFPGTVFVPREKGEDRD